MARIDAINNIKIHPQLIKNRKLFNKLITPPYTLGAAAIGTAGVILSTFLKDFNRTSDEENYFQRCMVLALYCLLARHFSEEGKEDFAKEQKEFLHILEYISEHFDEDINVNTLAERLFMYSGRLSSLFKKYSGMSLNEYVYSLRIKKANELMNQGSSIIEAAMQSGFQSVRTFNHVYKNITGITPKDYKKRGVTAE